MFKKCSNVYLLQTGLCTYLSFFKCVVDKSKNEIPNNKNVIAEVVFLSIKFIIDTIKKHIEASKKHINLILTSNFLCSTSWDLLTSNRRGHFHIFLTIEF